MNIKVEGLGRVGTRITTDLDLDQSIYLIQLIKKYELEPKRKWDSERINWLYIEKIETVRVQPTVLRFTIVKAHRLELLHPDIDKAMKEFLDICRS